MHRLLFTAGLTAIVLNLSSPLMAVLLCTEKNFGGKCITVKVDRGSCIDLAKHDFARKARSIASAGDGCAWARKEADCTILAKKMLIVPETGCKADIGMCGDFVGAVTGLEGCNPSDVPPQRYEDMAKCCGWQNGKPPTTITYPGRRRRALSNSTDPDE